MTRKKVTVSDKPIVKYKVLCSKKYGRYLVAGKKINAGEVILREKPVGIGPSGLNDDHFCFECLKKIPTYVAICDSNSLCSNCQVAIFCCAACKARKSYHTTEECEILENKIFPLRARKILLPLRLWLIKKNDEELWKKILRLEAHLEVRRDSDVWINNEIYVIETLKSLGIVHNSEENNFSELLQRICGILDVNSFGIRSPGSLDDSALRGLYLEASLMAHDCRGNTFCTVDDEFQLTIFASKPINNGEMILLNYTFPILGMAERQKILREEKYFECDCPMCQDPYELGTNLSTMFCPYCNDGLITFASVKTKNPYTKEENWKCNKCQVSLSGYLIAFYLHLVKMRIKSVENSIKELEVLLKKLSSTFHPNHSLMLKIKQRISALYRIEMKSLNPTKKKLNRMREIDTNILDILDVVEPGISGRKGVILYNIFAQSTVLTNLRDSAGELTPKEYAQQWESAEKYVKRSLEMLLYSPFTSYEGILAKKALKEYKIYLMSKTCARLLCVMKKK